MLPALVSQTMLDIGFLKSMSQTKLYIFSLLPEGLIFVNIMGFPNGSAVKNPPAVQETQETRVRYLEKEMATHPNILAEKILWTEEPGGLQSKRLQRVRHD